MLTNWDLPFAAYVCDWRAKSVGSLGDYDARRLAIRSSVEISKERFMICTTSFPFREFLKRIKEGEYTLVGFYTGTINVCGITIEVEDGKAVAVGGRSLISWLSEYKRSLSEKINPLAGVSSVW